MTFAQKRTVIDYIKKCLSSMDGDLVETIEDTSETTEEALQVYDMLVEVFEELQGRQDWESSFKPFPMDTSTVTPTSPTKVKVPDYVARTTVLRYDTSTNGTTNYVDLEFVPPAEFLRLHSSAGSNRLAIFDNGVRFYVQTNTNPTHYTTFDGVHLYFDAYKSTVDTGGLVQAKFVSMGKVLLSVPKLDAHIIDIPVSQVPILQSALNATASRRLRQQQDLPSEKMEQRQSGQLNYSNARATTTKYFTKRYGRRK